MAIIGRGAQTAVPGAPRWARLAAVAVPWCVLPSGLWRLAVVAGVPGIWHRADLEPAESVYMVGLTVTSEALALLTLGLIRPWGETFPSWLPLLGRRNVPVRLATFAAGFGAAALIGLYVWYFMNNYVLHLHFAPLVGTEGTGTQLSTLAWVVLIACYVPLLAWGPLLGLVTTAYYRRRTRQRQQASQLT